MKPRLRFLLGSPRRTLAPLPLLVLAAVTASGCLFQNASPVVRLRDNVVALNSDLRWNRLDLAIQMVAPAYRRSFIEARTDWGNAVQIADSDILGVRVVDGEDAAISTVELRWYSYATMAVRQTRVQQRWELAGREYYLADEAVTGGDARLLPGVAVVAEDYGLGEADDSREGEPPPAGENEVDDGDDLPPVRLETRGGSGAVSRR